MKIVNTSPGSNLLLGRQGENKARAIVFYIGPWVETYGAGVAQLLHQRKGDHDPYPVVITQEDNEVRWVVSEVDTSLAGAGRYELHYYVGDTLVKSSTGDTFVEGSMMFSTDPPDPYQGWFDRVEAAGSKAVEAEKKATEAASAAAESAESAAKNAEEAKDAAQSIPQTVKAALQEAKESGEFDGPPGPPGPQGKTGESGITTPVAGFFTLSVDADGNLYAYSAEGGTVPQMEYDSVTGNLYIVQEVED